MIKRICIALALLVCLLLVTGEEANAQELPTAPVKMTVPPEAIPTQAEGELEMYDITFPEEMPLAARNFVLTARAQFEKYPFVKLPKANEYTQWYYRDKREIGWCSVFQIWCSYHSGLQLIKHKQDVTVAPEDCISAMEGRVGNVYYVFEAHGRWQQADKVEAIPKPGYIVIYGKRGSTPYIHVGIVETVTELGDGLYELTTVEGNINSTIKRMNFRYDATPDKKYYNMSEIPEEEITRENCQYTVHKKDWYINGFGATW
ncbi:MAG: CHAP domain-containing protein [Clostridia bacterium]|nr:CHAP domain-containing protein [Clostridia bacterium]